VSLECLLIPVLGNLQVCTRIELSVLVSGQLGNFLFQSRTFYALPHLSGFFQFFKLFSASGTCFFCFLGCEAVTILQDNINPEILFPGTFIGYRGSFSSFSSFSLFGVLPR